MRKTSRTSTRTDTTAMRAAMIALVSGTPEEQSAAVKVLDPYIAAIVRQHRPRHLDHDEAQQIARVRVWIAAPKYDPTLDPKPFVSTVARRALQSEHVRAKQQRHPPRILPSIDEERGEGTLREAIADHREPQPVDDAIAHERDELIARLDELLPAIMTDLERAAFMGFNFRGETYTQIGKRIGKNRKSIDNALIRAIERIATVVPKASRSNASGMDDHEMLIALIDALQGIKEQRERYEAARPERLAASQARYAELRRQKYHASKAAAAEPIRIDPTLLVIAAVRPNAPTLILCGVMVELPVISQLGAA